MIKKRFVAGAVCPKCAAIDTMMMYREDGADYRECVDCGFKDKMMFSPTMRELDTRVNTTEEEKQQQTEVVKLVGFKQGSGNKNRK